jgi:heavy metal sensor kinase
MARPKPIRVRLTLWYALQLGLILVLFSGAIYLLLARALDGQVDSELARAAEVVTRVLRWENDHLTVEGSAGRQEVPHLGERGLLVRILNPAGGVIARNGTLDMVPIPAAALTAASQGQPDYRTVTAPDGGTPVRLYTMPYEVAGQVVGVVQVGQPLRAIQEMLQTLVLVLLVGIPATLLAASGSSMFLARQALAPIDHITRRVQRIQAADLSARLDLALPEDEVGRLAQTFDAMLLRLDEAFGRQRQFTADASHELRTPLAIMKGEIGVTLEERRSADEYEQVLRGLEDEVDRLTRLVENLLLLARADTGQPLLHPEPVDLAGLLQVVADQVQPLAAAKAVRLAVQTPRSLPLRGDTDKLLRLFLNLLDNAIKYTPPGGEVRIEASAQGEQAQVDVIDSGPGIPPEQLAQIFERFYRADASRTRASGGAGLGLAIARWIAEAHGGHIEARSEVGGGSTFRVWLPACPQPAAVPQEVYA